jgi:hypothetical protein
MGTRVHVEASDQTNHCRHKTRKWIQETQEDKIEETKIPKEIREIQEIGDKRSKKRTV